MHTHRLRLAQALVVTTLSGCAADCPSPHPEQPPPRVRIADWLDGDDLGLLTPERLLRRLPRHQLRLADPLDLRQLEIAPTPRLARRDPLGVELQFAADQQTLSIRWPIELVAAEVDSIELLAKGLRGRSVGLTWQADGAASGAGSMRAFSPQRSERGIERYYFPVHREPAWGGRVRNLELRLPLATQRVILQALIAAHEQLDSERVAAATRGVVQIDLEGDVRRAVVQPIGVTLQHPVTVSPAAELRTAIAIPQWAAPARLRVRRGDIDEPLLERSLLPGGRWEDLRVPLGDISPGASDDRIDLSLEVVGEPGSGRPTVAFWAHPAVFDRPPEAAPPVRNLLLISIDTLRADHLSLYGYRRQTSPQLDRWASRRALVFTDVVAASPWTLPSHASMFTGLDAHRHGVNNAWERVPGSLALMAEQLRAEGYVTQAFTGGGYLHPETGLAQGFDGFRYWRDRRGRQADDELLANVEHAVRWLESNDGRPFFLFLHTYEVHGPLRARQPHYERFGGRVEAERLRVDEHERTATDGYVKRSTVGWRGISERDPTVDTRVDPSVLSTFYDSTIAYVDRQLGWLFDQLEHLGLAEQTVVVVTSDHGELLGEHGVYNHYYLHDENLQVPLLIAAPGRAWSGQRVDTQVRTVDLLPTVLELLDLPAAPALDGVSLVGLAPGTGGTVSPPPNIPPAWSYAASTNYGLALQDDESKVILDNTPWVRDLPMNTVSHPPDASQARLLESAKRQFARDATGVRLRLQSAARGHLRGRFTTLATPLLPSSVKTISAPCNTPDDPCLQLDEPAGAVRFRIPPGSSFTLLLEMATHGVSLELAPTGGGTPSLALELPPSGEIRAARVQGGELQLLDRPLLDEETGAMIWWEGHPALHSEPTSRGPTSSELVHQLRALGYVD